MVKPRFSMCVLSFSGSISASEVIRLSYLEVSVCFSNASRNDPSFFFEGKLDTFENQRL